MCPREGPTLSVLWQLQSMDSHRVGITLGLHGWLLTSVVSLHTCLPMDHMSVTVFVHFSAILKVCFPFLFSWTPGLSPFRSSSYRFFGPSSCSACHGVASGHCFSGQTFSEGLTFSDFSLGVYILTCQYSLLLSRLECCLFFHVPLTFHAFCPLCMRCPYSCRVSNSY